MIQTKPATVAYRDGWARIFGQRVAVVTKHRYREAVEKTLRDLGIHPLGAPIDATKEGHR